MNVQRAANLFRQIAGLCLELAEVFDEADTIKQRKRPRSQLPEKRPSEAALDKVRRSLRKHGVAA